MFCLPQYIESAAAGIFRALRGENSLHGLERRPFIDRLAHYLGEVMHGDAEPMRKMLDTLTTDGTWQT